jgi:signal recognition particle subunit SRP54
MFDQLSDRLRETLRRVRGQARLTEENMSEALREVRMALLEADVALPAVKDLLARVRERAAGVEVLQSLTPGQMVVKIVHEELARLLGGQGEGLNLATRPPAVLLMAGLQGAGKTTTVGKLALHLRERMRKKVLVVSADIYRPAAIEQLATVARTAQVEGFPSAATQTPVEIARAALDHARRHGFEVLIVDTAGRLHVDAAMMDEIRALHQALDPVETLFVVDGTTGQDAVVSAKAFHEAVPLTGVILTKTDGDARGGAALSLRFVTGCPIKFLGAGERLDALEPFHPERVASRILGMGDVLTLVEEVERKVDREQSEKLAKKIAKGKGFDLEDYRAQLGQMDRLGGLSGVVDKLPGLGGVNKDLLETVGRREMKRAAAIINSMTPGERRNPDILRGARKRRIAAGSGTQVQDVNRLLKQFDQMQKMMKKVGNPGGMAKLLRGMKGRMPGLPF